MLTMLVYMTGESFEAPYPSYLGDNLQCQLLSDPLFTRPQVECCSPMVDDQVSVFYASQICKWSFNME